MTKTKPDFTKLTLKELVGELNKYTGKIRKSLFANKAEGVKAVEAAYAAWSAAQRTRKGKDYGAVIVMKARECPYLRGNVARSHWAQLAPNRSLGDYLMRFPEGADRSYARAWLALFARDGHVTLRR